MPNYCFNHLTLTGPKEELERFREMFEEYDYEFTYQAIIPAPDGLDIPESSEKPYAIALYLYQTAAGNINNLDPELIRKWDPQDPLGLFALEGGWAEDAIDKISAEYQNRYEHIKRYKISGVPCDKCPSSSSMIKTREQLYKFGEQLIRNKAETGSDTWYSWNCDHWGVKWDAGDHNEVEILGKYITLEFTSPWGPPDKVLQAIAERFPMLTLSDEVDCEGAGRWTIEGENGKITVAV